MVISYPLTMPASPGFQSARFTLVSNTAAFRSPLTGHVQVLERQGARWQVVYTLPPMKRALAAAWVAFLTALRGFRGTFNGFDPAATTPQGTGNGTPLVNGAGQTGHSLVTDGWAASETVLKAGDYLEVNARLHQVAEDATSDASGNATLEIEPQLRESPSDNAAITVTNPKVKMRLVANEAGWDIDTAEFFGLTFAGEEAL